MELKLKRIAYKKTYTIGRLFIDGAYFCDTLEDQNRDFNHDGDLKDQGEQKVQDQTCIPLGTYKIEINMSARFKRLMPQILDVPEFTGIRIHSGNTEENTSGCVLVGRNSVIGKLTESKKTFDSLMGILSLTKEPITITIL